MISQINLEISRRRSEQSNDYLSWVLNHIRCTFCASCHSSQQTLALLVMLPKSSRTAFHTFWFLLVQMLHQVVINLTTIWAASFLWRRKNIVNICCSIQSLLQQIPKIVILQTQPTPLTENQCVLVAFTMRSAYSTGLITLNIFLL
jgi:hypothetical protein